MREALASLEEPGLVGEPRMPEDALLGGLAGEVGSMAALSGSSGMMRGGGSGGGMANGGGIYMGQ